MSVRVVCPACSAAFESPGDGETVRCPMCNAPIPTHVADDLAPAEAVEIVEEAVEVEQIPEATELADAEPIATPAPAPELPPAARVRATPVRRDADRSAVSHRLRDEPSAGPGQGLSTGALLAVTAVLLLCCGGFGGFLFLLFKLAEMSH